MWDQRSKGWDQGSDGWDLGSQPQNQGFQAKGWGSAGFFFKDQAYHFCGIMDTQFVTLLESTIRSLGTNVGTAMKKDYILQLRPCYRLFYVSQVSISFRVD